MKSICKKCSDFLIGVLVLFAIFTFISAITLSGEYVANIFRTEERLYPPFGDPYFIGYWLANFFLGVACWVLPYFVFKLVSTIGADSRKDIAIKFIRLKRIINKLKKR
ncbi:hypothetical protein OI450_05945 [Pectobacterium cacticida]|uniref:Uncharacterized protein n=1 Tax=Pectobacterium cacticida TaxID=69221 RepID=A0ABZ2G8J7_9GAMM|nr:hypothetical protein [Pectobacterium cacticida]UYX07912.1 hypothetical protein OI450_05945 [Pectobacterium cacticida]